MTIARRRLERAPRSALGWSRAGGLAALAAVLTAFAVDTRRGVLVERVFEEPVVADPRIIRTRDLARGWEVILAKGRPGRAVVFVREHWRGKTLVRTDAIDRRLLAEPRREVRLTGTNPEDNAIHAPKVTRAVRTHQLLATAYDAGPHDNGWENAGITKLGWRTRRGIAAVDPAVIPLRTLLYVEGYGLAWAGDVGGAIKGNRVDLCFNRTEEVHAWGRRRTRAWVLEGGRGD